ncbi:MAG TPA: type II toxin-antitoxin system HicA family toxin [Puia sp.]|nr:type II toxin-antitoxin system HicA family toxin [Puia sp.]
MARKEKLLQRLLSIPNDLKWEELVTLLYYFGFEEERKGKTGGSRRKFVDPAGGAINLHKPHPSNIVKRYVIKRVVQHLTDNKYLQNE